jgi:plasmid replication initiation protein
MVFKSVKKKKVEKNELIIQHNNLIEARYRLSLQEKRVVIWLASQVQKTDGDFKEHVLSIKKFAELTDVRGDRLYSELQAITRRLMQRIISIYPIGEDRLIQVAWLGAADYKFDKGTVSLSFHPHLQPFILNLKNHFTALNLSDLMGLQSVYSIRIFELIKQYESIGKREISLKDLREYCGISDDKYKKFSDFKKRIIESSRKEINEKTDIFISYEEVKISRKITSIRFSINKNQEYKKTEFEKNQQEKADIIQKEVGSCSELIEKIMEYGFTKQAAKNLIQSDIEEKVFNAIKAVDIQVRRGNVKNPKAMIKTAIKECWEPDVFKKRSKLYPEK